MFSARKIDYKDTGYFSRIILDFLEKDDSLREFYSFETTNEGIAAAIEERKKHPVNRDILVNVLKDQYRPVPIYDPVNRNIESIQNNNCFTVCTAHQPNLLTGPLYFIYKIIHAIKLADHLKLQFPDNDFVPVYYMGSEDADLEELNHFFVREKKYEWNTRQTGAFGRMEIDGAAEKLINELEQQLAVERFGNEIISLLRKCYIKGNSIRQSTFALIHELFGRFGLVVLIPDEARLKSQMKDVFEDDLFRQIPSTIVNQSCERLCTAYKIQARPRDINLFYLKENTRERIDKLEGKFVVNNTSLIFSEEEIKNLLDKEPEVFSPNVILRGLFQEKILPNVAFIGGGGEIAYWLQLKDMFLHYQVPFPVLVLRNSFLIAENKWLKKAQKLDLSPEDLFLSEEILIENLIKNLSRNEISLNGSYDKSEQLFSEITQRVQAIDTSLVKHVEAIKARSLKQLKELEKKMLRSEKRKFNDQQNQLRAIRNAFFPGMQLQERRENFTGFYSRWGRELIDAILLNSPALEQRFTILEEKDQSK